MATLNIKGFPDALYEELRNLARSQHRSVSQQVINILSSALAESEPLSILQLKGLGKEAWEGVDAAEHVKRERESWG